jgi:hypothetical protein
VSPGTSRVLPADLLRGLLVALAVVLGLAVLDVAGPGRFPRARRAIPAMELDEPPP